MVQSAQDFFDKHTDNIAYVAMDARMGEIFLGVYQRNADGYAELIGEEAVTPAENIVFLCQSALKTFHLSASKSFHML